MVISSLKYTNSSEVRIQSKTCPSILFGMKFIEANHNQIYSEFQRNGRITRCFYCGKEEGIVASHSITEKRCLDLLTEPIEGERGVYGFKHLKLSRANWHNPYHFADFEIVGTKKASTFKGFCKAHDQNLFQLLDNSNFDESSMECKFRHCYRAFAKAIHTKNEELKSCNEDSIYKEQYKTYIIERKEDIEIGLNLDIQGYEFLMNKWMEKKDYTQLNHVCFRTNKFHPIASASFCQPTFTINNNRINDYKQTDTPLNHIFINIVPESEGTYILISCFKNQPNSMKFLSELNEVYRIDKDRFGRFLTTLLIFYTENTFMAPSLVNSLPDSLRRNLLLNLKHSITDGIQNLFLDKPINGSLNLFENQLG